MLYMWFNTCGRLILLFFRPLRTIIDNIKNICVTKNQLNIKLESLIFFLLNKCE